MYSGKKAQYDFPKMRGGVDQRPFGTFPKIHPFWYSRPSLSVPIENCHFFIIIVCSASLLGRVDLHDNRLSRRLHHHVPPCKVYTKIIFLARDKILFLQADSFWMGEPAPVRGGAGGAGERVDSPQLLLAQLGQSHAARKRYCPKVRATFYPLHFLFVWR